VHSKKIQTPISISIFSPSTSTTPHRASWYITPRASQKPTAEKKSNKKKRKRKEISTRNQEKTAR
jgi:hypothetical protein